MTPWPIPTFVKRPPVPMSADEAAMLRLQITVLEQENAMLENENAMLRTALKEHTQNVRRRMDFDQGILGGW